MKFFPSFKNVLAKRLRTGSWPYFDYLIHLPVQSGPSARPQNPPSESPALTREPEITLFRDLDNTISADFSISPLFMDFTDVFHHYLPGFKLF